MFITSLQIPSSDKRLGVPSTRRCEPCRCKGRQFGMQGESPLAATFLIGARFHLPDWGLLETAMCIRSSRPIPVVYAFEMRPRGNDLISKVTLKSCLRRDFLCEDEVSYATFPSDVNPEVVRNDNAFSSNRTIYRSCQCMRLFHEVDSCNGVSASCNNVTPSRLLSFEEIFVYRALFRLLSDGIS
jgi:hypothetical protein